MKNNLGLIGFTITTFYLIFIYHFFLKNNHESLLQLDLNNLGDFLAGVFGPIAILWLVLGFFQQGKELKQNTAALELQAEELKKSVEAQNNISEANKLLLELEINKNINEKIKEENKLLPIFKIANISTPHDYDLSKDTDYFVIILKLLNVGEIASEVSLNPGNSKFLDEVIDCYHHSIPRNKTVEFKIAFRKYKGFFTHKNIPTRFYFQLDYTYGNSMKDSKLIAIDMTNFPYDIIGEIKDN